MWDDKTAGLLRASAKDLRAALSRSTTKPEIDEIIETARELIDLVENGLPGVPTSAMVRSWAAGTLESHLAGMRRDADGYPYRARLVGSEGSTLYGVVAHDMEVTSGERFFRVNVTVTGESP